ncbi:MAG TPA: TerC family protein [Candidatus Kapabacteria bacterium]|nr:TerC family protein [Candidatus Kapabacteria bacterium]
MSIWWWVGFNALVLVLLLVDLGVFHRNAHEVKPKEALIWSIVWISLAAAFNVFVYFQFGQVAAVHFATGYIVEESLSVDNLFVFVLIFNYFAVPAQYQHRILFWGIIGALIMRASLISFGAFLVLNFKWVLYVFGAFLIYTGVRMAFESETSVEIEANPMIKLMRRWFPVTNSYHGQRFLIRDAGRLLATPMLVVLVMIESTDLVFALDSIPAIFGVTHDIFIVYTSNVFAILGLRSLYFLLANVIERFHLLKYGLASVLAFVGIKMVIEHWVKIHTTTSLIVVVTLLAIAVVASLIFPQKEEAGNAEQSEGDG